MSRQKIAAGNWKMNLTLEEGRQLVEALTQSVEETKADIVLCPPFLHLTMVKSMLAGASGFSLGAQNCHQELKGAFTGEVSVPMLKSAGVEYVILGHSERREYYGETDALLAKKTDRVLDEGLRPIFCCGESLPIREEGTHLAYVRAQISASLFHLSPDLFSRVVIAYEPIWAIGTGRTASPEQAQEMHAAIRSLLAEYFGTEIAGQTPILYGGSVNAGNAASLFSQPDVDGGLVGGASLKAEEFLQIVRSF